MMTHDYAALTKQLEELNAKATVDVTCDKPGCYPSVTRAYCHTCKNLCGCHDAHEAMLKADDEFVQSIHDHFPAILAALEAAQQVQKMRAMRGEGRFGIAHKASVKIDAAITSVFGWPWSPDAQLAYARCVDAAIDLAKEALSAIEEES